jgi:Carboxypeptidase regulatory-like domain
MNRSSIVFGIAISVAAIVGACDGRSPTSPNRIAPATQPIYSLTGIVTEPVGVPVEGATVTVADGPYKGKSSRTDGAGHYTLIGVEGSFNVQVDKDGYTSSTKPVTVPQILALDVEITLLAITGNISGSWNVTFEPARCPSPLNIDARKYRASIAQQGAQLTIALSGATFATPPQLTGTIHDLNVSIELPSGCDFYCYYGPTSPPAVIENIGDNQFLAIYGQITATVGRSSITGTLSGDFALMRHAVPPFDIFATCGDANHRVTFTR